MKSFKFRVSSFGFLTTKNLKLKTSNQKPQTKNLKPKTSNQKPQTKNPKLTKLCFCSFIKSHKNAETESDTALITKIIILSSAD